MPVGAVVLLAAALWITEGRAGDRRRIDLLGAVLATAGLAAVAYGIVQTEAEGWAAAVTLVPLLAGLGLLALFVLVEARTAVPLVPLRVFSVRAVSSANAAMLLMGSATFAMWYFMTVYAQNVLGYTPLEAGLALMPTSAAVIIGSKLAPRLMVRTGAKSLAVALHPDRGGGLRLAVHAGCGGLLPHRDLPARRPHDGRGLASTPLATLATSGADPGDAGLVSGLVNTSRTMGGALGLAVLSTVAAARTAGSGDPVEVTAGYAMAFRTASGVLLFGTVVMLLWLPNHRRARRTA